MRKQPDLLLPDQSKSGDAAAQPPITTMVTRVPVLESGSRVWGYDLLLDNTADAKTDQGADPAGQAAALSNAFALVMPFMGKDERLNLPFGEGLLLYNAGYIFPAEICCLDLRGPIEDAAAVGQSLAELKEAGYILQITCSRQKTGWMEFLPLAGLARVDAREFSPAELTAAANWLKAQGLELLAENVTADQVKPLLDLGFKYLQGDLHTQSDVLTGKNLSSSQIVKTRLLKTLAEPEWEVKEVAELIRADVSLSYRLLRYLNSAHFSLPGAITSIESSVVLLGRTGLAQWIYVAVFSDLGIGPLAKHIVTTAAFRGKFLELLAGESSRETPPRETLFMLGLFSMLETLLNLPLQDIAGDIKMDDAVTRTLQGEDTPYQPWFSLLLDYERGHWDRIRTTAAELGLTPRDVSSTYTRAMTWVAGLFE